jgi:hypothetical protein
MAAPLLAAAAMLAPTVAHADPIADYVSRNGKAVCAELDKVQDGGDFFRLALTVAHDGKFNIKDAANVIGRAVATDCPSEEPKLKLAGTSAANPPTPQVGPPDH